MSANRIYFSIAAITSAAFAIGMLLAFPLAFWNFGRIFASVLVASSVWLFSLSLHRRSTDTALGLGGVAAALCFVHLLVSIRILVFSVTDESNLTAAFCVANTAFGLIILITANAAAGIIDRNIQRNDTGGEFAKVAQALRALAGNATDTDIKAELLRLAEELRYYPRWILQDGPLVPDPAQHVANLERSLQTSDADATRARLVELRRALEAAKLSIQPKYSKV